MKNLISKIEPLQLRYIILRKYEGHKNKYTLKQRQNIFKLIESELYEDLILAQEILSC